MSDIAAVLVGLGLEDEAAFHGLCFLVEECCPGYHDVKLTGYRRDTVVLGVLIRRLLPERIGQQLDAWGVPIDVLALEHFVTLGAHTWQPSVTVQLWDLLLLHGQAALFASFLALLELCFPFTPEVEEQEETSSAMLARWSDVLCGEDTEPMERINQFRDAVVRAGEKDLDKVLKRTRELIPLIPQELIEQLRLVFNEGQGQRPRLPR
jgi:hypothetical protein